MINPIIFIVSLAFSFPQNYYELDLANQKKVFISTIAKMTKIANNSTLKDRNFALNFIDLLFKNGFRNVDENSLKKLVKIAKDYKIEEIFNSNEYIKKLDIVPISLSVVQAAIESGWGKSRFAKEANNLYGHWTWGQKGLVPLNRDENKTHKIKIFDSLQDSVNAYVLNLNSHPAYLEFRDERYKYHSTKQKFDGLEAAKTMEKYSQMGKIYVKQLEKTIMHYNLTRLD